MCDFANRAELTGTMTTADGLQIDVQVVVNDPSGAAETVARDLIQLFDDYLAEETGGPGTTVIEIERLAQELTPAEQLRHNIDRVVGGFQG